MTREFSAGGVVFYLMEYQQEAQTGYSWETEAIDWLPFEAAKKRLAFEKEKEILDKAKEMVENSVQPTLI